MYKPNHTQTPNEILDKYLPILKGSELKVLLIICRQTIGWHKETDRISISQLELKTGLSNRAVIDASRSLEKKGIIITDIKCGIKSYELDYEESSQAKNEPMKKVHTPYEESSQVAYEESSYTKETLTKETKQKKARVNGANVPDVFVADEVEWIRKFVTYMKDNHRIIMSSMQTEIVMYDLGKFKAEGCSVIEIIKQSIVANHKKLYKPDDFGQKKKQHEQPRANSNAYKNYV